MTTGSSKNDLNFLFRAGKLLSAIDSLCMQLEHGLNSGAVSQLEFLLDSVYRDREFLDFCDNYSALIPTTDLYRRVHALKSKLLSLPDGGTDIKTIKTAAHAVLDSLEHFASPSTPWNFENEELKYMMFPWVDHGDHGDHGDPQQEARAVLHYLYYEPVAVPDDRWIAEQFYSFRDQAESIEYFETLVDEIKVNLFSQKRHGLRKRVDIPELRWPHYGIFFDGAIKGKSYGGALLVMMLLWYIETLCGVKEHGYGGYFPATVILAEIQPGGTTVPCDHLPLRLKAVLDEYDSRQVRLILAEGNRDLTGLSYRQGKYTLGQHTIPGDRVHFVRNTTELCAAAFPLWKDLATAAWRKLSDSYRQNLLSGLADETSVKVIQQEFLTGGEPSPTPILLEYTPAPGDPELKTSFHFSSDYEGTFDLRFGFEEGSFLLDPGQEAMKEVVVIAVDGSHYTESAWSTKSEAPSQVSSTVFEILQNLARQDRAFYLHFLSTRAPELLNVNRYPTPGELDKFLQKQRRTLDLTLRGGFLAPVARYWWNRGLAPHKRLIVISNGPVYDHNDFTLREIFWDNLWFCYENACTRYLPQKNLFTLADIPMDVKERLKVIPRKITRLKMILENWFPYQWSPAAAVLKSLDSTSGARIIEVDTPQGLEELVMKGAFLANSPDKGLEYEIDIRENGASRQVSGHLSAKKTPLLRCGTGVVSGMLPGPEWDTWESFHGKPTTYICPVCDRTHPPRLKCSPRSETVPVIIFPSLRRFKGFVILEPHNKQWVVSGTGAKIDETYFFKMDGAFYMFCPGKRSLPQQVKTGNITVGTRTFYLEEL